MLPWRRSRDQQEALSEALEGLQKAEAELARLRSALARAEAEKEALERETLRLRHELGRLHERVEAQAAELATLEDRARRAEADTLDRVARALAAKPGPAFAQDETGAWVASFPQGEGRVAAFRISKGESRREFKRRVWRAWLDYQLGRAKG